jgi:hypothetical protein
MRGQVVGCCEVITQIRAVIDVDSNILDAVRALRRVTLVGNDAPYCLERSFERGLHALGVETRICNPIAGDENQPTLLQRVERRLLDERRAQRISARALELLASTPSDLVVVVKGLDLAPGCVAEMRSRTGAPVVCFYPDDPFQETRGTANDRVRLAMPLYDCYFIWGRFLLSRIGAHTGRRVEYLPFGYDPTLSFPADKNQGPIAPVGFIGGWDEERADWLRPLADLGLIITGDGWHHLHRTDPLRRCLRPAAMGAAMATVVAHTAINLNLLRKQNGTAHNMRTFELPACGAFMLTRRSEEQEEWFPEGIASAAFADPNELREAVLYYRDRPNDRASLAREAFARVQSHSYAHRMEQLLSIARTL